MAVIDLVKWDGNPSLLAWKFPSEELSTWTQLIVNETQEAFVVRGGVYDGPFEAGRHTLETQNLPFLRGLLGLPFGEKSPFAAEVWYVNKTINLNIPWGTPDPIQLQDPKFGVMVPVRAFGQYGIQVEDAKKFLLKLVGTLHLFDVNNLKTYFAGILTVRIKRAIAEAIVERKVCVLETSIYIEDFSTYLQSSLAPQMEEYGLRLSQFTIKSINVPEDDHAVIQLKKALAKKSELDILGISYQQDLSFGVLQRAAENEGTAGGVMGAGLGLGLGAGIGVPMSNSMSQITSVLGTQPPSARNMTEVLAQIKAAGEMHDAGHLTTQQFEEIKKKLLEQQ